MLGEGLEKEAWLERLGSPLIRKSENRHLPEAKGEITSKSRSSEHKKGRPEFGLGPVKRRGTKRV